MSTQVVAPLCKTHYPPTSPGTECHSPGRCPYLPPASLSRLSLCPAPHAYVCCRILRPFAPPLLPRPAPRSLSPPGGLPAAGPASLHVCCATYWHLMSLVISGCTFIARKRGQGASTPCQSLTPPPPCVLLIPSLLEKAVGSHARGSF